MEEWILQYWMEVLFTLIVSGVGLGYRRIVRKMQEEARKQETVKKGIEAMLRDRLIQIYDSNIDKGFCPVHVKENVEALYEQYQALGGNGMVTGFVEELRELPIREG